jgi:AmmeMemoRadiSam system protein B
MKRTASNAGAFYPAQCDEIERMIVGFNRALDGSLNDRSVLQTKPRAIIAPHAGYIYSGFTANIAHRLLGNSKPERIVVIGPSHHVYFEDISISEQGSYESPCGDMDIDTEYGSELATHFATIFVPEAHAREHSTETQIPFIRYYDPHCRVVEMIYGNVSYTRLSLLIDHILSDPRNAVVISSDLSHFHNLKKAEQLDSICLEGIEKLSTEILNNGCEACGIIGIKAMIETARKRGLESTILDYRTSADTSGDTSRVVGYANAVFSEK